MQIKREDLSVGRVLHEDDDFITLEIAKHDGVSFTLSTSADVEGEQSEKIRFLTLLFLKKDGEKSMTPWKPWED